jgi:hypothetical protein
VIVTAKREQSRPPDGMRTYFRFVDPLISQGFSVEIRLSLVSDAVGRQLPQRLNCNQTV